MAVAILATLLALDLVRTILVVDAVFLARRMTGVALAARHVGSHPTLKSLGSARSVCASPPKGAGSPKVRYKKRRQCVYGGMMCYNVLRMCYLRFAADDPSSSSHCVSPIIIILRQLHHSYVLRSMIQQQSHHMYLYV